jgi:hypothetical protein
LKGDRQGQYSIRTDTVSPPAFRYFVDHFPVFVDTAEDPSIPVVSFCYIEEGVIAAPAFETYLRNYAALFALLGRFRLVHVSAVDDCEERAKAAFAGLLANLDDFYSQSDSEGEVWRSFISSWSERFGERPVTAGELYDLAEPLNPGSWRSSSRQTDTRSRSSRCLAVGQSRDCAPHSAGGHMRDRIHPAEEWPSG